jgi:GT2 family glycosyltransferase
MSRRASGIERVTSRTVQRDCVAASQKGRRAVVYHASFWFLDSAMNYSKVQFVIVNYRTAELTVRCVKSIIALGIPEGDIVVVDNFSRDSSVEIISSAVPNLKIIRSKCNSGYGAAINLGMKFVDAEFAIVLNPDTIFTANFLDELIREFESDGSIAIIGFNLLNPDLTPQYSARRFYSLVDIAVRRTRLKSIWPFKMMNDRHLMKAELNRGASFEADWVMGTGFAIRRSTFEQINGMDEDYFLYMEDVDLCARIWCARKRVVCMPTASIIHDHQRASAKSHFSEASKQHWKSLRRFSQKFSVPVFHMSGREHIAKR